MSKYTDYFGAGSQPNAFLQTPLFSTNAWVAPADGFVIVQVMGAGGGGARSVSFGTGGYSGAIGIKKARVKKGDVISCVVGTGGAFQSSIGPGQNGGDSSVVIAGTTYTAPGGAGGLQGSSALTPPDAPTLTSAWDISIRGCKPGASPTGGCTGGAGVNIKNLPLNTTTSASTANSAGGGTGSPSVGTQGGGAITGGFSVMGTLGTAVYTDDGGWCLSFFGGAGGQGNSEGFNGGGGGSNSGGVGRSGGIGGGGGAGAATAGTTGGGNGGIGAGGGAGGSSGGAGGNGFICVNFIADTAV